MLLLQVSKARKTALKAMKYDLKLIFKNTIGTYQIDKNKPHIGRVFKKPVYCWGTVKQIKVSKEYTGNV